MKIPSKCKHGHALKGDNLRMGRAKLRGGEYADRWFCRRCQNRRHQIYREKHNPRPPDDRYGPRHTLDPEPFKAWFHRYCRRNILTVAEAAKRFGIDEKQIRRLGKVNQSRGETGRASVALVDRVLMQTETNIQDLYPELYPDE
jgi:hypothetical protein